MTMNKPFLGIMVIVTIKTFSYVHDWIEEYETLEQRWHTHFYRRPCFRSWHVLTNFYRVKLRHGLSWDQYII